MLITYFLFISWFVAVIYRLDYPLFSIEELKYVPDVLLKFIVPQYLWISRIINILIIFLTVLFLSRRLKIGKLSLFVLLTSPWLYILSREYNPLIGITLIIILYLFLTKLNKKSIFLFLLLILLLLKNNHITQNDLLEKIYYFKNYLSLVNPFFQTEQGKYYLFLPKIGYFLYPSLLLLFIGLFTYKIPKIIQLMIISFIIYLIFPSNYFIFSGINFIFILIVFIIKGSDYISPYRLISIFLLFALSFNFLFFLEVYFRHHQIMYGGERKFAELNIVKFISKNYFNSIYSLPNGDITRWYKVFQYHQNLPKINEVVDLEDWLKLKEKCLNNKILCIVDKPVLLFLKMEEQDKRIIRITDPNGLNRYFLL